MDSEQVPVELLRQEDMLVRVDSTFSPGILFTTARISRAHTTALLIHWYQAADDQAGQPHPLADPIAPPPANPPSSALDAPENLERLAAPLLAIQRGLPLLSRLLAR